MDLDIKSELRGFEISHFRNIGFKPSEISEKKTNSKKNKKVAQELILNYSLNKDLMGDLVILIGPNNSGKSNVLNALECFYNKNLTERDKSDTFIEVEDRQPSLKLLALDGIKKKDGEDYVERWVYTLDSSNNLQFKSKDGEIVSKKAFDLEKYISQITPMNIRNYVNLILNFNQFLISEGSNSEIIKEENQLLQLQYVNGNYYPLNLDLIKGKVKICLEYLEEYEEKKNKSQKYNNFINSLRNIPNTVLNNFLSDYDKYLSNLSNLLYENKKYPYILNYADTNISDTDLSCSIDKIDTNSFFKSLFQILDGGTENIKTIYQIYHQNKGKANLYKKGDVYTKKLEEISNYFNQLYCIDDNVYTFKLKLETTEVNFTIYKGTPENEVGLTLNYQSTGFKWFFDFFFNIFAPKQLKPGDIIIMDEPATNLHVRGQEELRKFLKDFAIKYGLTFVIATHSPFLIDLDYLDEVRIISSNDENIATIESDFTVVNPDDADSLLPIRESLTTRNSVILDPDQVVVFVEGSTDYNYLVAMKNLFDKFKNLTFLPINGLGNDDDQIKEKIEQLRKIKKYKNIIFTDGDPKADKFKEFNQYFKIISTSDLGSKFNTIENLFSKEDVEKFHLKDNNLNDWIKTTSLSVTIKKYLIRNPAGVNSETKENFEKILDYIEKIVSKNN